jgi:hypothetical protein
LYVLVDRDVGVIESLKISRQITAGNKLSLFLLYIVGSVLGILGVCAFCIGYLFVVGFMFLMLAVAYLTMSGQSIAIPAPYSPAAYAGGPN